MRHPVGPAALTRPRTLPTLASRTLRAAAAAARATLADPGRAARRHHWRRLLHARRPRRVAAGVVRRPRPVRGRSRPGRRDRHPRARAPGDRRRERAGRERRRHQPAAGRPRPGSLSTVYFCSGMPTHLELTAEPRDVFGKHVRRLRRQGIVPANIYGHGSSRAIQATARALEHLLAHGGRTGVVSIGVDGRSETALMKGVQRDPRSGKLLHVEFQAVSMEESVTSSVPVRFVGESLAVTKLDGVMTHPRTELHVTARAADLPDAIEVDVSSIRELHGAIHVSDLPQSSTYKIIDPPDEVLAIVLPPKVEVEEIEEAAVPEAAEAPAAAGEPASEPEA